MNTNLSISSTLYCASVLGTAAVCFCATSSAEPLTVKPLSFRGTMPYVQSANPKIAQRINSLIYLAMLELPAPARLQDGLKELKSADRLQPPSDIVFEVGHNDERILALTVSAEGCGAYCENYTVAFNFDVATGRHVIAGDIFTPAGSAALLKQLDAARIVRIKAEIAKLRRDAVSATKGKGTPAETDTNIDEAIEMYQQCVASRTNPESAKYRNLATDDMKIGKDTITFVRGRCSNHASRALDEIGDFANTVSLKDLAPNLSAYGKSLLLGGGEASATDGSFSQVLIGKIGQAPITIRIGARNSDDSLSATYYYDKYRKPISLFGKVKGSELTLAESDSDGKVVAVIRATISGESLKGNWSGGGKQIAFEVGP